MFKVTLRNCYSRLREIGKSSIDHSSSKRRTYRSGFQRTLGAIGFLFIYFLISYELLDVDEGSTDNYGILVLLVLAVIVASLGWVFAPNIAAFTYWQSVAGRRHKAQRPHHNSRSHPKSNQESDLASSPNRRRVKRPASGESAQTAQLPLMAGESGRKQADQ